MPACSLVQDSGAPAWLSTAPRDPCLIAPLAALAVSDGSLCSRRCSPGSRCLRRLRRNDCVGESALHLDAFRRLLLQISGANIAGPDRAFVPPTSSSLPDEKRVPSLLLSTAPRDPCLIAPLAALAPPGSRFCAAYFVVAPGRKACPLAPPQHGAARSGLSKAPRCMARLC